MSYSKAGNESSWAGKRPSSLAEAGRKDAALSRTLHAVDSAVGAQHAADRGRREAESRGTVLPQSTPITIPAQSDSRRAQLTAGSQIEMADMSGRSSSASRSKQGTPGSLEAQAPEPESQGTQPCIPDAPDESAPGHCRMGAELDKSSQDGAKANGGVGESCIIQMPHEDPETEPSRWLLLSKQHSLPSICSIFQVSCGVWQANSATEAEHRRAILQKCGIFPTLGPYGRQRVYTSVQGHRSRAPRAVQQHHVHLRHVCQRPHRVLPAHRGASVQHPG